MHHHLTCSISSLLHSVNLIVFTPLLVYLILRMSPHQSHHLRSHHHITPSTFYSRLKTHISFTNPFLHHFYSFRIAFKDLITFSFFLAIRVLDKAEDSVFESTLNSAIVSYRIDCGRMVSRTIRKSRIGFFVD